MSRPRKHRSNLPPCVYQKHGAFWLVKRNKWTKLGVDFGAAMAAYGAMFAAPTGGMPALIERVLTSITPKLAKSTVEQYHVAARKLKEIMAEFSPEQVRPKHVAGIKVSMADTPAMANRCLSFLRVVFNHAVEQQLVESNPCLGVMRHVEAKRDRYITDDELARVYLRAGERLKVIIALLYYSGQRVNDVLKLNRADCGADGVSFRQAKTKTKLTVKWNPGLTAAVERAKRLGPRDAIAFALVPGRAGKSADYRSVSLQWQTACTAASVPDAHIHDLRAKSLTDAKRDGFNATSLAGHTSPAMTERYLRLRESPLVDGPKEMKV